MVTERALISHTSYEVINESGKFLKVRKAKEYDDYKNLLYSCDIGLSTVIVKKELLKDDIIFPNLKTKEDFVLWLKLLSKNVKIYGIDKNLVLWSKIENSLSSSLIQKLVDGFKVYNHYMKFNFLKSFYYLVLLSFNYLKK